MKNNRTFKSLPTYGEIESGLFHKPAVMRRFLMEFMLNGKVEREEVECEDWSKAKHFIQRKYKLQDEPRVIREVKTCP